MSNNSTPHGLRRMAFAIALLGVATAGRGAGDASGAIPAQAFFSRPSMDEPVMSPDGAMLAIRVRNAAGRRQLAVLDTSDMTKVKILAGYNNADVGGVRWISDRRLMFQVWDQEASAYDSRIDVRIAVNADGSDGLTMNGRTLGTDYGRGAAQPLAELVRTLADGSNDVIEAVWAHTNALSGNNEWTDSVVKRYDTHTGRVSALLEGKVPHGVRRWVVDERGRPVAAMAVDGADSVLLAPTGSGQWTERTRFKTYGASRGGFGIVGAATDGKVYAVHATGDARGSEGLYRLDLNTGRTDPQPLVTAPGFGLEAVLIQDHRNHKVLGVHYRTDAESTAWFDPDWKALQARIDARLPGLINRIDPAACACEKRVLVTSHSDRDPGRYFLYDRTSDLLIPIGSARPDIKPEQMAVTDFYRVKARDGQDIPTYVTRPAGKGPWPTVVLVHGGPYLRGWDWAWDGESQFLASRGYLVVKPEFRGSEGYGAALLQSGFKQWGLKMQDDIADATIWAAAQGLEDPKRTCIMGGSYGGYATLMGLVRYGDLYRCGVAFSAVTDINLLYDVAWSDASETYKSHGMPELIGDQVADAEQLKMTSPILQASRISRPLLLAHGGIDRRVPIIHATRLLSALEANHAPVTWIEYKDEAHGWSKPETRISFYDDVLKFLDANTAPGSAAAAH